MALLPSAYPIWWYGTYVFLCAVCMLAMPSVHPYDRCMSISSVFILLAASHVETPVMPLIMCVQTAASIGHWLVYSNSSLHKIDKGLSIGVFVWNVFIILFVRPRQFEQAVLAAAASACVFKLRTGIREKALTSYRFVYVIPHAAFRFFAFWFVMLLHGQSWSWGLTAFYWATIFLLALPFPMPPNQDLGTFLNSLPKRTGEA